MTDVRETAAVMPADVRPVTGATPAGGRPGAGVLAIDAGGTGNAGHVGHVGHTVVDGVATLVHDPEMV